MLARKILIASVFYFFYSVQSHAESYVIDAKELKPDKKHLTTSALVNHILNTYHYKKTELNNSLSSLIFDNYLESLDKNKSYFLQKDIDEFEKYRYLIDDSIKKSNYSFFFTIFKRYRQRVSERVSYSLERLNKDFNFNIDEYYNFDRRKSDWVKDKAMLDQIWRKRIKNDMLNLILAKKEPEDIKKTLSKRYESIKNNTYQLNSNDVFQIFLNSYTTSIEPHTSYFSPRTSKNFDISMRLSLEGIGAVLRANNDYTQVVKIIVGGPADLSNKLNIDDRIVGIGQGESGEIVDVIGWRLDEVVDLIRGPKDTKLRLEILPKDAGEGGPYTTISLVRDKIKLEEQDASSKIIFDEKTKTKLGVIELPTFYIDFAAQTKGDDNYKSTSRDIRKLLKEMEGENIDGLVIDLRGNGGGSLYEALELTGLFIDKGPVVQTKNSAGKIKVNNDPEDGVVYAGPLAVLVDSNSASASEIFAGAIQDYKRGIIVGENTFGKGTVQNVIDLNKFIKNTNDDHGRLKITVAQFFRVNGDSNQFKGVKPDIIFPKINNSNKKGERIYDNALPWDQVASADYLPTNSLVDDFELIKKRHLERTKNNELFQLLVKELELTAKIREKKQISLLESNRKKEREELLLVRKNFLNAMRIEKGLPILEGDAVDLEEKLKEEEEEPVDIILKETIEIISDLISIIDNRTSL